MDFSVLTIFPELTDAFFNNGIIKRAVDKKLISCTSINIRDYAEGKHRVTDDRPYGGGCGMVMKPEPLAAAIRAARERLPESRTILLSPQGPIFTQKTAHALLEERGLILVCGRYEGVDDRICHGLIDDEISIGDYVLTGGEIGAMVIVDAVTRLIPGALGGEDSARYDSFQDTLLEHPHYTRPSSFEGMDVPEVLISGNHSKIEEWRLEQSIKRTFLRRPDLLTQKKLKDNEIEILRKWCREIEAIIHT